MDQHASRTSTLDGRLTSSLFSAVIADALDELGYREQAMDPGIVPLDPGRPLFGRALTVTATAVHDIPAEPYRKELEAVDALNRDDVLVASVAGGGHCGFWGELLTTAALAKGAAGAIIDGFTRDSNGIVSLGFPLFARGCSPLDSKGRSDVIGVGATIDCGGVRVSAGDLVFGDRDGVVVLPSAVADHAIEAALVKVGRESEMRAALRDGMGVLDAYERYGVL